MYIIASARRRIMVVLGQPGLAETKAAKRAKVELALSLRRIAHSISFLPTGSATLVFSSFASAVLRLRMSSSARLMTATSEADVVALVATADDGLGLAATAGRGGGGAGVSPAAGAVAGAT